jgi:uncharacterized oligopeptide transporter (OPT) family protein
VSQNSQRPFKEQFTVRGIVIGLLGSVIISASSVYIALKLGALPWPIFFVVLLSLFLLKALAGKNKPTNINEANVSASTMSAGAMVAGGLAFTIPGIYILMPNAQVSLPVVLLCALCGVGLGCMGTSLFRKHFIQDVELPFPVGKGAAETLEAGDKGGHKAALLFGSLAFSGIFTIVRGLGALPTMLLDWVKIPGVNFGVYASPMALAMGFMIGPLAALVWIIGGVLGNVGVVMGGTALGFWDVATATGIRTSLGIGVMIGCGVGIIVMVVIPKARQLFGPLFSRARGNAIVGMRWAPFALVAIVLLLAFVAGVGLLEALLLVLLTWIVVTMAAQCTGQAGMNPMEVFGVIVLLVITLVCNIGGVEAFLVAATATVACGFVGDLMNDFKAGHILGTNPKAQWIGELLGGIIGAVVGVGIIGLLVSAYGTGAFGRFVDGAVVPGSDFVAAQAGVVASMIGGIPNLPAFFIGLIFGVACYMLKAPVITFGLGIYLPFYLTVTVAIGAAVRFVVGLIAPNWAKGEDGMVIASGLLGGESIIGVIFALVAVVGGLLAI